MDLVEGHCRCSVRWRGEYGCIGATTQLGICIAVLRNRPCVISKMDCNLRIHIRHRDRVHPNREMVYFYCEFFHWPEKAGLPMTHQHISHLHISNPSACLPTAHSLSGQLLGHAGCIRSHCDVLGDGFVLHEIRRHHATSPIPGLPHLAALVLELCLVIFRVHLARQL